jgi:hypothetical protein
MVFAWSLGIPSAILMISTRWGSKFRRISPTSSAGAALERSHQLLGGLGHHLPGVQAILRLQTSMDTLITLGTLLPSRRDS